MSGVKKLAGQTLWYGIPTILSRFIGYIMNFTLLIFFAQPATTADITQLYAAIPFLNVLFTYGLETAYFRFSQDTDKQQLYNTLSISLLGSSIIFSVVLFLLRTPIAEALGIADHKEYMFWMMGIVFFDAINTLAFAKLRQENRPRKYAFVRLLGIAVNFLIVVFFAGIIPRYFPGAFSGLYQRFNRIDFYLIGNLFGSLVTFLLLFREMRQVQFKFNRAIWKKVIRYSYPLVIVGMGGMVNDMLSRLAYRHVVDLPTEAADNELAIFGNIYRLALLITIMIQAFRMAAEPFFFNRSREANAPRTYASIMKFFVIACCFMFLFIGLYLDVFRWLVTLINREKWLEGIGVVPLLAMANVFLGIYYNLSIWYKLTNKNLIGALITLGGVVITVVLNVLLIPRLHYTGAALATFCCYLFMMVCSYWLGQKYYPIPYARKKLIAYLVMVTLIYLLHLFVNSYFKSLSISVVTATILMGLFTWFVFRIEKKELQNIPFLKRFYKINTQ